MFNPRRTIKNSSLTTYHRGADLTARTPLPIYVPSGAVTERGNSPKQHYSDVNPRFVGIPSEEQRTRWETSSGGGCGIWIQFALPSKPGWHLKYCHLSNIPAQLLDDDGVHIKKGVVVDGSTQVATTGATGGATVWSVTKHMAVIAPHLHLEVTVPGPEILCKRKQVKKCFSPNLQLDPFTLFVDPGKFNASPNGATLAAGQTIPIQITARDANGALITSAVGGPNEYSVGDKGTDPARKLCVTPSVSDVVSLGPGVAVAGISGSQCIPWQSILQLTALSNLPADGAGVTVQYTTQADYPVATDLLSRNTVYNGDFAAISLTRSASSALKPIWQDFALPFIRVYPNSTSCSRGNFEESLLTDLFIREEVRNSSFSCVFLPISSSLKSGYSYNQKNRVTIQTLTAPGGILAEFTSGTISSVGSIYVVPRLRAADVADAFAGKSCASRGITYLVTSTSSGLAFVPEGGSGAGVIADLDAMAPSTFAEQYVVGGPTYARRWSTAIAGTAKGIDAGINERIDANGKSTFEWNIQLVNILSGGSLITFSCSGSDGPSFDSYK